MLENVNVPLAIGLFMAIFTTIMVLLHCWRRMIFNQALKAAALQTAKRFDKVFNELPQGRALAQIEYQHARELMHLTGKDCSKAILQLQYQPLHEELKDIWLYQ